MRSTNHCILFLFPFYIVSSRIFKSIFLVRWTGLNVSRVEFSSEELLCESVPNFDVALLCKSLNKKKMLTRWERGTVLCKFATFNVFFLLGHPSPFFFSPQISRRCVICCEMTLVSLPVHRKESFKCARTRAAAAAATRRPNPREALWPRRAEPWSTERRGLTLVSFCHQVMRAVSTTFCTFFG